PSEAARSVLVCSDNSGGFVPWKIGAQALGRLCELNPQRSRGATVEGMNMGAYFLAALGILVLGSAFLVALGLAIAGKTRAAVMTFAVGLLGAAVIASLATLSFLQKGMGFYEEGSEPVIALT